MHKLLILLIFVMGVSCSPTKKLDNSVGNWDFVIKGTPNGDVNGYFAIAKEGESYSGTIYSDQGSNTLNDLAVVDDILTCNFNYQGYRILMSGNFAGNSFNGKISVDYNDFPMTAMKRQ